MTTEIPKQLARQMILKAQLLNGKSKLPKGKKGAAEVIKKLGYIQIDTLAVVNRSHHHTLWTRRNDYTEKMLHDLQAKDKLVFEYWGHAMSYFHMDDFRFFLPKMENFRIPKNSWVKNHLQKSGHLLEPILKRIKEEGPLSSKDFDAPEGKKQGSWWDWKPAKMALELLFWRGDLMVSERRNFNKIYDLTERVLPKGIDLSSPSKEEVSDFLVLKALSAFGIADDKEICKFMQPSASRDSDWMFADKENISKSLKKFLDSGQVIQLKIEGVKNLIHYSLKEILDDCFKKNQSSSNVYLLSPFDNLIIQRERIKKYFDFNYSIECYLPAAKRKYGYFVMPILWGDQFVGRFDPKADRATKELKISNLIFEPGFKNFDNLLPQLANTLNHFALFNNCSKVIFENLTSKKIKSSLLKYLSSQ